MGVGGSGGRGERGKVTLFGDPLSDPFSDPFSDGDVVSWLRVIENGFWLHTYR